MSILPYQLQPAYVEYSIIKELFEAGYLTKAELDEGYLYFVQAGKQLGVTISTYNEETQRRPQYPEGNNSNRTNFMYGAKNKKFSKMQRVMKPATIKAIKYWHKWVMNLWDKDAYVYDDARMQALDTAAHEFVDLYFDHQERKLDFMHKVVDIGLFYMKEDIYYSGRLFMMLNLMPYFILTPEEQENIATFRRGVQSVDVFSGQPNYTEAYQKEMATC